MRANLRRSLLPLLLVGALALGCAAPALGDPAIERPRPNVVYILADDLGYAELSCYGQEKMRTPNIDRLAREGMRFTQHYSGSPVCAPSRCVLLTGLHTGHAVVRNNWENGGWGPDQPEGQLPLPEGTQTIAGRLKAIGYRTAAIGKWGLGGPGTSGQPDRQGFDLFHGYLCQRKAHNYYPTHLWRNGEKVMLEGNAWFSAHQKLEEPLESESEYAERFSAEQYAPELMAREALDFIRKSRGRPFFLYYASPIPHAAIQVPSEDLDAWPSEWDAEPYLGQKAYLPHPRPRAGYAAMVARLDRDVGRILDLLEELGLAQDTLVVFSRDNGPTFNGGTDSEFFESAGGLRGLKCSVYEGGIRVPMIARWPDRIAPRTVSETVSGFQDVLPTVLELAGGSWQGEIDGISLAPTLLGRGEQAEHDYLYWEYGGQQAIRMGPWKGVRPRLGKGEKALELYHLERDPAESRDLAAEHPEIVERLEEALLAARTTSVAFPIPALDGG